MPHRHRAPSPPERTPLSPALRSNTQ
jgi:hypothetical protein